MNLTGIILSGGLSSRMGTDKALILLDKEKMIEKSIHLLKPLCNEILISANKKNYNQFGYKVIKDKHKKIGPLGGIISCLSESKNEINIIISCDTPNIKIETLKALLQEIKEYDVALPYHNNRYEPLIAVYNKKCLEKLKIMANSSSYKLQTVINNLNSKRVILKDDFETEEEFININSKKDLKRYYKLRKKEIEHDKY